MAEEVIKLLERAGFSLVRQGWESQDLQECKGEESYCPLSCGEDSAS